MIENADLDIKNLEFTSEDTGYIYTKTYSEYKWKFTLDGIIRNISLYHSKILGRRTIYLGNREICRYQRYTYNFHYSFPIDIHTISITQSEDSYILKIDGIPFNKLLNEQKLNRFNIIRDIFSDKNNKINKKNIKPLLTYKGGRGNIVISNRNDISKRDIYKTNINSAYRENDIENDKNIINTSSKRTDNTLQNSNINSEYYNYDDYNYEEASEDLSNKAIDGGDSQRDEEDEDEDEKENEENNIAKENNNLNDIFQTNNNFNNNNFDDEDEIEEEPEEIEKQEEEDGEIDIKNNNKDEKDEDESSSDEEEQEINTKEKKNEKEKESYNNINNELMPIKFKKNKKENKSKESKETKKEKKKTKNNKVVNKDNENYNYDEDDIYNINNDNNNDSNINNENHIDLLGEEIYNSSRDKDKYINDNINNNFNINEFISQQNV